MKRIRLTKAFNFEMAHALPGHDGPCRHIHGHSYELFVTIVGTPIQDKSSPKYGMLMDFKDIKQMVKDCIIDEFDHSLVLNREFVPNDFGKGNTLYGNLILVDYQPTTENLLIDFAGRIMKKLPTQIKLYSLKLRETLTSFAEWFAEENQ
ncbi:MAG: 6-carboxytetrahydropterin synthase [Bacteroidetes bacterium]|nr:6-carboxytetrahydropterin synthase [Bacteroidota bacterium]